MRRIIINTCFLGEFKNANRFRTSRRNWLCISVLLLGVFLVSNPAFSNSSDEECTIGVASGKATVDGRPLLWKNRDKESVEENEVIFINSYPYDFLAVTDAGEMANAWMGVNNKGFAILNSVTSNIDQGYNSGYGNGSLMTEALRTCATLEDFVQLLERTNEGRQTATCIGVIDSTGAAALLEVDNYSYTIYPASDTFVVRANFALSGSYGSSTYSMHRYKRAKTLFQEAVTAQQLDHRYILQQVSRDLINKQVDPYPLPYDDADSFYGIGYLNTYESINRYRTRSASVFHGVLAGENPLLTTMWIILGEPVTCAAVPLWVYGGMTPPELNGPVNAPLNRAAIALDRMCYDKSNNPQLMNTFVLDNGAGGGFLPDLVTFEDQTIAQTATLLDAWRAQFPEKTVIKTAQADFAKATLQFLQGLSTAVESSPGQPQPIADNFRLGQSYPNPFSLTTQTGLTIPVFRTKLRDAASARVQIFNTLGQLVFQHTIGAAKAQSEPVIWQGFDTQGARVANGVYFITLQTATTRQAHKILILK